MVAIIIRAFESDDYILFRSFDRGESFQDPISLENIYFEGSNLEGISDLVFTKNGTMFFTLQRRFGVIDSYVYKSTNLGLNWTIHKHWKDYTNVNFGSNDFQPRLGYDSVNNLLYFVMPAENTSFEEKYQVANFSFSVLNLTSDKWSPLTSTGFINVETIYATSPDFVFIRKEPSSSVITKVIFKKKAKIEDGKFYFEFYEFNTTDFGQSYNGPYPSNFDTEIFTSNLEEIYYIKTSNDGNDMELFFSREGRLIKNNRIFLSPINSTYFSFDGIDDFGEYLKAGNYSYTISLKDSAGNSVQKIGWFYVDYNKPSLTDLNLNWTFDPIPRQDVKITINAADDLNFSINLIYRKDNGPFISIPMLLENKTIYSAIITGDLNTSMVQYYIRAIDLAGNVRQLDADGAYYSYDLPQYKWEAEGLFEEIKSYSSSKEYTISVTITQDIQYIEKIIFRYSLDNGKSWIDLELEQNSPTFTGTLKNLPGDLRTLHYQVIIIDIFGEEIELTELREIEFYPELPKLNLSENQLWMIGIISAIVGFMVAFGYITLKNKSHDMISKEILYKEYKKRIKKIDKSSEQIEKTAEPKLMLIDKSKGSRPFLIAYLMVICINSILFSIGIFLSVISVLLGVLIIGASLLVAVLGYMLLMSRDIMENIYLEKIQFRNILLETFQIIFMLFNLLMILFIGYSIDWFRYYLIESTFNFGAVSIPRLYLSVIGVFFTSLVLVAITTLIQLRKSVNNLQKQRIQGASDSLLLYLKDQSASHLITRLGYKTIVFLVTVLISIITTTDLLTFETGILLLIIVIPFIIASFLALYVNRKLESRKIEKKKDSIGMPFIDAKKLCPKCGKGVFLANKFCSNCGEQLVFEDIIGTYIGNCKHCNSLIHEETKYCPSCGKKINTNSLKYN
ncbi:MAG: double zinc ribbon domain-containing protein [Promethearchaeota archaeon]